jgi:hypothetical protein
MQQHRSHRRTSFVEDLQYEAEDGVQRGRVLREQRHILQRRDQLQPVEVVTGKYVSNGGVLGMS